MYWSTCSGYASAMSWECQLGGCCCDCQHIRNVELLPDASLMPLSGHLPDAPVRAFARCWSDAPLKHFQNAGLMALSGHLPDAGLVALSGVQHIGLYMCQDAFNDKLVASSQLELLSLCMAVTRHGSHQNLSMQTSGQACVRTSCLSTINAAGLA